MKKKRFSVEQIVAVLKQTELGVPVAVRMSKASMTNTAAHTADTPKLCWSIT